MVQILWLPATSQKLGPSFQFGTPLQNSFACVLFEMCEIKLHTHVRQQKKKSSPTGANWENITYVNYFLEVTHKPRTLSVSREHV